MPGHVTAPLPSPMASQNSGPPQTSYGQQFSPSRPSASPASATLLQHPNSYGSHGAPSHSTLPQTPIYQTQQAYTQHTASATAAAVQHHNPAAPYNQYQNVNAAQRAMAQSSTSHSSHPNAYHPPRQSEIYTLAETANSSIPADIRNQFQQDDYGKVLFFTAPPLDVNPIPEKVQPLGHSLRYLADKARNKEADEKKRKERADRLEQDAAERVKRIKASDEGMKQWIEDQKCKALLNLADHIDKGTDELYKQMHGDDWQEMRKQDLIKLAAKQEEEIKKQKRHEEYLEDVKKRSEVKLTSHNWMKD
jgi:chromatin structure-remodeling complex subunit RSC1/2